MRPEAIVAVVRSGCKVLLIQRGPGMLDAGYWAPVSGEIDPGESQEAAVVREVRDARWMSVDEILGLEKTFEGDREFFQKVYPLL